MCCFTGHVSDVSATNIFARVSGDREYVVYEMTFTSDEQTAMILPIPIASGALKARWKFVALDDYADFFRDLEGHFQKVWSAAKLLGGSAPQVALKVQLVGAFEASFVPSVDDFDRLDPRFRISREVWQQCPAYSSFGFVVFKLQPGRHVNVHPMAFSFRARDPATIFYPTLHVHDGTFHETASFDHILYTQNEPARAILWPGTFWMPSGEVASRYLKVRRTHGLVSANAPCFQMSVVGTWPNSDIVIPI
jgi:hypothetical protein